MTRFFTQLADLPAQGQQTTGQGSLSACCCGQTLTITDS
jgi:hypothetical protein